MTSLDDQFKALEAGSDVDDELAALKSKIKLKSTVFACGYRNQRLTITYSFPFLFCEYKWNDLNLL